MLDIEAILKHLAIYNYSPSEADLVLLRHFLRSTKNLIYNFCHIDFIPPKVVHPAIEYICGCFLLHKIETGTLNDEDGNPLYEFSQAETSIKMGNVSVNLDSDASMIGDNAFLTLVKKLSDEDQFKNELVHYRKIKWKPS